MILVLWILYLHVRLLFVFGFFFQEALTELEQLKQIVPKESLVYFLIGKV